MGIGSFKHDGLEELFEDGTTAKIGAEFHKTALGILDHLNGIESLQDCVGVKKFHALKGDRKGTYAMSVSANYRITFAWEAPDVTDVNFEDYH